MHTLLLLLLSLSPGEVMPLEDFFVRYVSCIATQKNLVVICHESPGPKFQHAIFNFDTGEVTQIEDARIEFATEEALFCDEGIALINSNAYFNRVFILDLKGNFQRTYSLEQLKGRPSDFRIITMIPMGYGRALCTGRSQDSTLSIVAELDLNQQSFEVVYTGERAPRNYPQIWLPMGKARYRYVTSTGQIDRLDPETYRVLETVQPPREVVPKKRKPRKSNRGLYLPLLGGPVYTGPNLHLRWFQRRDYQGRLLDEYQEKTLTITPNGIKKDVPYVVARYRGQSLILDNDEGSFSIVGEQQ